MPKFAIFDRKEVATPGALNHNLRGSHKNRCRNCRHSCDFGALRLASCNMRTPFQTLLTSFWTATRTTWNLPDTNQDSNEVHTNNPGTLSTPPPCSTKTTNVTFQNLNRECKTQSGCAQSWQIPGLPVFFRKVPGCVPELSEMFHMGPPQRPRKDKGRAIEKSPKYLKALRRTKTR